MIYTQQCARSQYHTQVAKTSFDKIFDLTAGMYFCFYNIREAAIAQDVAWPWNRNRGPPRSSSQQCINRTQQPFDYIKTTSSTSRTVIKPATPKQIRAHPYRFYKYSVPLAPPTHRIIPNASKICRVLR